MAFTGSLSRLKSSAVWSIFGNISGQLIRFGSNLLLTRLLFPSDFGLMALVQTVMVTLTLFSDIGITQAFVYHRRGEEVHFKRALWTLQLVRGCILWGGALICAAALHVAVGAGWVGSDSTYGDPRLPLVIAVSTFQLVLSALSSSKAHIAHRTLQQRELMLMGFVSQFVSIVTMLLWAWISPSIWALVVGGLVAAGVSSCLSHTYLKGEPDRWLWDAAIGKELMRTGGWVFISTLAGFLGSLGDRFIIGGIFDSATFGLYAIACLLISPAQIIFNTLIISVAFPAFSEFYRTNPDQFSRGYAKFQRHADWFLGSAAGFLCVAGEDLVQLFYDRRYHEAGWMLSLIGAGLIGARFLVVEQAFSAMGKFKLNAASNLVKLASILIALPLFNHFWGIKGCLSAVVFVAFSAWPLLMYLRRREKIGTIADDVWIFPSILLGACGGIMLQFVIKWFFGL